MRHFVFFLALAMCGTCTATVSQTVDYVIHVSVDGLRSDAVTTLGPVEVPNFYRLRSEGSFTDNARTDPDVTVTMPNHVCMLTGRGQLGPAGHNVTRNSNPGNPAGLLGSVGIATNANTITVAAWFKFADLGGDGSDAPIGVAQDIKDFVFAFVPDGSLRPPSCASGALLIIR